MFSDVAILCLPVPIIMHLHLLTKHKLAVLSILLTGSIVIVAGIGRTVAYFSYQSLTDNNFSADYYSLVVWTSLEPTLGVVGACLPCVRPAFKGWSPESIMRSMRSVISLKSLRSLGSSDGPDHASRGKASTSREGSRTRSRKMMGGPRLSVDGRESTQGFTKMREEDDDEVLDLELGDLKAGTWGKQVGGAGRVGAGSGSTDGAVAAGYTLSYAKSGDGHGLWMEGEGAPSGIMVQRSFDVVAGRKAVNEDGLIMTRPM